MRTTMPPKERIRLQADIYRDMAKDNQRLREAYEEKKKTESWAEHSYNAADVRATIYELVANKLDEILADWDEMDEKERKESI